MAKVEYPQLGFTTLTSTHSRVFAGYKVGDITTDPYGRRCVIAQVFQTPGGTSVVFDYTDPDEQWRLELREVIRQQQEEEGYES